MPSSQLLVPTPSSYVPDLGIADLLGVEDSVCSQALTIIIKSWPILSSFCPHAAGDKRLTCAAKEALWLSHITDNWR